MSPGWRLPALLLAWPLFTACARENPGGPVRWQSFPVTLYADATIVHAQGAEADLGDSIAFWEEKAGKKLFDYRGLYTGGAEFTGTAAAPGTILANVISKPSAWPFAFTVAGQTSVSFSEGLIQGAVVMVNGQISTCAGDCTGSYAGATSERRVIAHELGHFLGLQHVNDPKNLMNPTVMPGNSLATLTIDTAAFAALTQ